MAHLRDERGEILVYGDADQCINLNQLLAAFLAVASLSGASTTVINQYITNITNNLTTQNVSQISQVIQEITNITQIINGGGARAVDFLNADAVTYAGGDGDAQSIKRYGGVPLFSLAAPTSPAALADGFYLFTLRAAKVATSADADVWEVELDTPNAGIGVPGTGADSDHLPGAGAVLISWADQLAAGDTFGVTITNGNGASSHDFQLTSLSVTKLG